MRVDAGHVFFSVGDPASFSVRIVYGKVRCTADTGEQVDVGTTQVLGALDAWIAAPRTYGAVALTPVIAYRTRTEDFLAVLENHPSVALDVLQVLAASLIKGGLKRG